MLTSCAPEVPFSAETPETWIRSPAPRLAFTVAPVSWYWAAVSVPVPFRTPLMTALFTVSSNPCRSKVPAVLIRRFELSARTPAAPRVNTPSTIVVPV